MAYYTLALIKKNLAQPTGTSIDTTLDNFGAEADAWVDSILGIGVVLSTVPTIITHIASNYAAGRYLQKIPEEAERGKTLMQEAEKSLREYMKGPGMVSI